MLIYIYFISLIKCLYIFFLFPNFADIEDLIDPLRMEIPPDVQELVDNEGCAYFHFQSSGVYSVPARKFIGHP